MQLKGRSEAPGLLGETRSWVCTSLKGHQDSWGALCFPPISPQGFGASALWNMEFHVIKSVLDACRDKLVLSKRRENAKYNWAVPSGSVLHSAVIKAPSWDTVGSPSGAEPLLFLTDSQSYS